MILKSGSGILLAFALFISCSLFGQVSFESEVRYNIGPSPQALKSGDFNNDGWLDIISANLTVTTTKHISLMINNKVGGFTLTNLTAVKGYIDLEIADFDNDGNLDFVAASNTDDKITIFLGNGNGTFSFTSVDAGDGPLDILTGDFNEDTNTDIAVLHQSSDDIYIFYGDGLGAVGSPQIISIDVQSSNMTAADFNGDTHLDIMVGANTELHFYEGDGAGNLANAVPTSGDYFGFDYLESADIDNDGDADIVGAGSSLGFTATGVGDGTFGLAAFVPEGGLISISGDFDADGNIDVISTKKNKLIYYPGDGTGVYYTTAYHRIAVETSCIVAGDWDNDGNLDLATGSTLSSSTGYLHVIYGKGNGYFEAQFEYPTANNPRGLTSDDYNEDGLEDLALVADGNLLIYTGQADGTFTKISTQTAGVFPYDIESIHINADTHVDLAVLDITSGAVNLFTGDGTGVFVPAGNVSVTANFELFVDDVNNDNIDDLILAGVASKSVQIFEGNGDETFSLLINIDIEEAVYNVLSATINADANPDLAVLVAPVAGPREIRLFQGDGMGGFTPAGTNLSLPEGGQTFTKEDFNNDGFIDFLSLASDGDIYTGNGDFSFNYSSTNTGVSLVEHSTEVKDIDGDGFGDLITGSDCSACTSGGRIQVNRGNGDGTFSASFWSQQSVGGYRPVVSDFNNDGKNDIASLVNNTDFDGLSILLNTSIPPDCDEPQITLNPASTTLCDGGEDFVLSVSATSALPLTYQWQKDGVDIVGSPNSASFTLTGYTTIESGIYRCIISNVCGSATSSGATITIDSSPETPSATGAMGCKPSSLTLTASGSTDGNYRWYEVAVGGSPIAGEVNSSFITPSLSVTTDYYVAITDGTCESSRATVTAVLLDLPVPPGKMDATECAPSSVTLSASGSSDGNYRWYEIATGGSPIADEVNSSYTTHMLSITTDYYVAINDGDCESDRVMVTANLIQPISITVQPQNQQVSIEGDATFTVTAAGDNINYQWQKDGTNLQGENSANLLITNVNEADQGDYSCKLSNDCSLIESGIATLSIVITGIDEKALEITSVYSNPSDGIIFITNKGANNLTVKVSSLHGNEMVTSHSASTQIALDLTKLPNGIYWLTIDNGTETVRNKILIMH